MTKRIASLTSMILLGLGMAAFTGSALAGNGNGSGKDEGSTGTQPANGSAAQNSGAEPGVKPTNATAKNTTCSTGGGQGTSATCAATGSGAANASSAGKADSSKKYGNGKTAAQVANSRGAPAGTQVYGPGNSQPHKVWDCRRQHWVDVHAVKSYSTASCNTQARQPTASETRKESATGGASVPGPTSGRTTGGANNSAHTPNTTGATSTQSGGVLGSSATGSGATAQGGSSPTGGVLGVTASGGNSGSAGGVLGAIESVGSGVLPFTGFPLWIVVLAAAAAIVLGLALRRRGHATV
jgi:hypothetical protein